MTIPWALAVPVIIFLGIIVPIWITFHYITLWLRMRSARGATTPAADAELTALRDVAERLERRLVSIETILDTDSPDWRHK